MRLDILGGLGVDASDDYMIKQRVTIASDVSGYGVDETMQLALEIGRPGNRHALRGAWRVLGTHWGRPYEWKGDEITGGGRFRSRTCDRQRGTGNGSRCRVKPQWGVRADFDRQRPLGALCACGGMAGVDCGPVGRGADGWRYGFNVAPAGAAREIHLTIWRRAWECRRERRRAKTREIENSLCRGGLIRAEGEQPEAQRN